MIKYDVEKANQILNEFLQKNYDYMWMKTMLRKGREPFPQDSTLITGSSYALHGIKSKAWKCAVNCSMHSQDLYYSFLCAKNVLSAQMGKGQRFKRCFIIMGSFTPCADLSLSTSERERWLAGTYYPLFHDAHHWESPTLYDPWESFSRTPKELRNLVEQTIRKEILRHGDYFSPLKPRTPFFDLQGRNWHEVSEEEKLSMGKYRAEAHSKGFCHGATVEENKEILRDYVHLLHQNGVLPVAVMMPYTRAYGQYILPDMLESVRELANSVPEHLVYVDLNEGKAFGDEDFIDTDHLNDHGAEKACGILTDMFGR